MPSSGPFDTLRMRQLRASQTGARLVLSPALREETRARWCWWRGRRWSLRSMRTMRTTRMRRRWWARIGAVLPIRAHHADCESHDAGFTRRGDEIVAAPSEPYVIAGLCTAWAGSRSAVSHAPGLAANRPALPLPVHCYAHTACSASTRCTAYAVHGSVLSSASLITVQPNTQPNALLNTQPFIAEEIGIPSWNKNWALFLIYIGS